MRLALQDRGCGRRATAPSAPLLLLRLARHLAHGVELRLALRLALGAQLRELGDVARALALAQLPLARERDARGEVPGLGVVVVLRRLAAEGRAIVVISSEMQEVIGLADRILVIDDGRVVQEGTHEQLLAEGGLYGHLYRTQFAGEPVEA